MRKWIIIGILLAIPLGIAALVIWQPQSWKTRIMNDIVRRVSEDAPYNVVITRVYGNPITGYSFRDVRLSDKKTSKELLHIKRVAIGLSWSKLLFHKMVEIKRLTIDLGDGRATLKGYLHLQPTPVGEFDIVDERFPLGKLAALSGMAALPVPLRHNGRWAVHRDSTTTTVTAGGTLDGSPLALTASLDTDQRYRVDAALQRVSFKAMGFGPDVVTAHPASIHMVVFGKGVDVTGTGNLESENMHMTTQLNHGVGTFKGSAGIPGFMSTMNGEFDLRKRWVRASGETVHAIYKEMQVDKLTYRIAGTADNQRLDADISGLRFHKEVSKVNDIASAHLSLNGSTPRWRTNAAWKWQDGATGSLDGAISQNDDGGWRLSWDKLALSFPTSGNWSSAHPGSATYSALGVFALHEFDLSNGPQQVNIREAVMAKSSYHANFVIKALNPDPWAKRFMPDISLPGALNASLNIRGTSSDLSVDGYINGQFPELVVKSVGLNIQSIDMQLRSADKKLDIVKFTGKMKKGDVAITGGSVLPNLKYALHAKHLTLEPYAKARVAADIELALAGTVESPDLTGHIDVTQGMFPRKVKDKNAPPEEPGGPINCCKDTSLDLQVSWPRNVWYRDGTSSIETRGDIRIAKDEGTLPVVLTGTITSLRGSYNYFGRDFNIESGQILFAGEPELNPAINVEATYASGATTVYLDFTGTFKQPVLKLRSNPPLADQDIVSVIVFGQPLSQLRSRTGGSAGNQEMMSAAGSVLGSYVSRGLNQTGIPLLDFDILNIQPADQGGSQVNVGRYLTRRLFVNYGQTVQGSAEKTITADYFLTDKWTLQGASDSLEGNYLDFLFRYPLNKRASPVNSSPVPRSPFRNSLETPGTEPTFRTPMQ